jgi:putative ABC transport system permease protein
MVVARAFALALIGVAAGGILAFLGAPFLRSLLYGVGASDPLTFGAVALLLLAVAVVSATIPAWRAARVDPVTVLRAD